MSCAVASPRIPEWTFSAPDNVVVRNERRGGGRSPRPFKCCVSGDECKSVISSRASGFDPLMKSEELGDSTVSLTYCLRYDNCSRREQASLWCRCPARRVVGAHLCGVRHWRGGRSTFTLLPLTKSHNHRFRTPCYASLRK